MTTEIARIGEDDRSLAAKVEWAKTLAVANLLPPQYQGNPGNLLYAVEYADALGIDRINAITSIHVISGKPSASAELIASLVRRAGHKLRVTGDDTQAVAQIIRSDDPDFTFEARWDEKKARAAGLWGKGNWAKYPAAMLRARAITEVARAGASDALFGVVYSPEELGAKVDEEGKPVDGQPLKPTMAVDSDRTARPPYAPVVDGELVEEVPGQEALPVEDPPDDKPKARATKKQVANIGRLATELGLNREQKLAGVATVIGREVETTKDLSPKEASDCIESMQASLDARGGGK